MVLPAEPANPYLHSTPPVSTHLTRTGGLQPTHTLPAHQYATTKYIPHLIHNTLLVNVLLL